MSEAETLNFTLATLNYSQATYLPCGDPWFMDTISCPLGTKRTNFEDTPVTIPITDLRGQEDIASLDKTGFQTLVTPSTVSASLLLKSGNDSQIKESYYPEVEKILKKVTKADKIFIYDHTFRRHDPHCPESPILREPVLRVHVDQTPKSAHDRIGYHVPEEFRNWKRFQLINVWRSIGNTVYDYPLAMADFRTVDVEQDLVPVELRYPDWLKDKETYAVKYNPKHKWYYWSHMEHSEVLLIKCYDSASRKLAQAKHVNEVGGNDKHLKDHIAGLTPHSAFFHEKDASLNIRRQSIEVRAIALHM